METKGWDVFRVLPPEQDSSSEAIDARCMSITVRILKVIAYIVSFCVVLGGAVISKSTFLFMTSQVSNFFRFYAYLNELEVFKKVLHVFVCTLECCRAPGCQTFHRT